MLKPFKQEINLLRLQTEYILKTFLFNMAFWLGYIMAKDEISKVLLSRNCVVCRYS